MLVNGWLSNMLVVYMLMAWEPLMAKEKNGGINLVDTILIWYGIFSTLSLFFTLVKSKLYFK